MGWNQQLVIYLPTDPITLSVDDWGVQSPPKCEVFRFVYHSQKVIGSLGPVNYQPQKYCLFFFLGCADRDEQNEDFEDDHFPYFLDPKWRAYMNNKMSPQNLPSKHLTSKRYDWMSIGLYILVHYCWLLKSGQPVEGTVVYPIIYRVWNTSQVVSRISSINSMSHRMPMFFLTSRTPLFFGAGSLCPTSFGRCGATFDSSLHRWRNGGEAKQKNGVSKLWDTQSMVASCCFWLVGSI